MEPLTEHLDHTLYWMQPKALNRVFELSNDVGVLATLRFDTAFGSLATAETSIGAWSLKRVGFFRPVVTVRQANREDNVAVYRPKCTGAEGDLELGRSTYTFARSSLRAAQFEIRDSADRLLVTYCPGAKRHSLGDLLKTQAEVKIIEADALARGDLALLILIGWYIIVLHNEDSSTDATPTIATAY